MDHQSFNIFIVSAYKLMSPTLFGAPALQIDAPQEDELSLAMSYLRRHGQRSLVSGHDEKQWKA